MSLQTLRRFGRDGRGIAIVEFALILPLLITLSAVTFDLVRYVIYMRKVELAASTLADLVARLPAPRLVWLMLPAGAPTFTVVPGGRL